MFPFGRMLGWAKGKPCDEAPQPQNEKVIDLDGIEPQITLDNLTDSVQSFFTTFTRTTNRLQLACLDPKEIYFTGLLDEYGRLTGNGRLMSHSNGFVDGTWYEGALIDLVSAEYVCLDNGERRVFHIRQQSNGFLFTCDSISFVARVGIELSRLPRDLNPDLDSLNRRLIALVQVQDILEDSFYYAIQMILNSLENMLAWKSTSTTAESKSAEDFYQISIMLKVHQANEAIVQSALRNDFLSNDLQTVFKQFNFECERYERRNRHVLKVVRGMPGVADIRTALLRFVLEALKNHKASLIQELPRGDEELTALMMNGLDSVEPRRLLFLDKADIVVFRELIVVCKQLHYIKALWTNFLGKMKHITSVHSLSRLKPMTSSLFPFLVKSFVETVQEICEKTDMDVATFFEVNERRQLQRKRIKWQEVTSLTICLEQQYIFLHKLLDHFAPANYTAKTKFEYELKMVVEVYHTGYKTVPTAVAKKAWSLRDPFLMKRMQTVKDPLQQKKVQVAKIKDNNQRIWLYLIDSIFSSLIDFYRLQGPLVFCKKVEIRFLEIAGNLIKVFAQYLEQKSDQDHEACRTTVANFIQLMRNLTLKQIIADDIGPLERQLDKISRMLTDQDEETFASDFANLMSVYSEYWQRQESMQSVETTFAAKNAQFEAPMKVIMEGLRKLHNLAMMKTVSDDVQVQHLRSYNEFFRQFVEINFDWIVKKSAFPNDIEVGMVRVVNEDKENYVVLKPMKFNQALEMKDYPIPKHYKLEAISKLGNTAHRLLMRSDWDDEDIMNCLNSLYFAMGYSFRHYQLQSDYVDFENFLVDSTSPFENIVLRSETPKEFNKRIQNIESFFLYSRKMDEMSIEETIQLFEQEMAKALICGFETTLFNETLKVCIEKYLANYNRHMEEPNVEEIIKEVMEKSEEIKKLNFKDWTPETKQELISTILAGLSAVWSINASKDLEGTGKWLKPHLIQIICILRLLSADRAEQGVINHLAQVLTGQGKSIILGLLSTMLALCGFDVRVACYSKYLAERDYRDFAQFFVLFDVDIDIAYGDFKDIVEDTLYTDHYGDGDRIGLRSLVIDTIENKLQAAREVKADQLDEDLPKVLLVDEVDVFFSDNFYGNTYNPVRTVGSSSLEQLQLYIWNTIKSRLIHTDSFFLEVMQMVENSRQNDQLIKSFWDSAYNLLRDNVKDMIECAKFINRYKAYGYQINDDGYIAKRDEFGLLTTKTIYSYHNAFAYLFLKGGNYDSKNYRNYGYLLVNCGNISYAKLPLEYPLILGVTGTLTSLNKSEKEAVKSYNINHISSIPTFFGRHKLKFDPTTNYKVEETTDGWLQAIYESCHDKIENHRAVLIFFTTEDKINIFKNKYSQNFARLNTLTGNEDKERIRWIVNEAGVAQTVTLATRHMGRGTDFKSNDSRVEKKGGTHVIQTFFSKDVKEEIQIKGRTARKDNKGSYELIVCSLDFVSYRDEQIRTYSALYALRRIKSEEENKEIIENIAKSEELHNKTMEFFKSFAKYHPNRRMEFIKKIEEFN